MYLLVKAVSCRDNPVLGNKGSCTPGLTDQCRIHRYLQVCIKHYLFLPFDRKFRAQNAYFLFSILRQLILPVITEKIVSLCRK